MSEHSPEFLPWAFDKVKEWIMTDSTPEQVANRIDLWRSQILNPEREEHLTPTKGLLEAFEADVRVEALREAAQAVAEAVREAASRLNAELQHDGREEPGMAAYISGFADAYAAAQTAAAKYGAKS